MDARECNRGRPIREGKAGEEIRTLDINLGKVALYQLSYARTKDNSSRVGQGVKGALRWAGQAISCGFLAQLSWKIGLLMWDSRRCHIKTTGQDERSGEKRDLGQRT